MEDETSVGEDDRGSEGEAIKKKRVMPSLISRSVR
jgi:hypothetical protein